MTPIAKARLVNWLLTISFGFFLFVLLAAAQGWGRFGLLESEGEHNFVALLALLPYLLAAFIAHRWPSCPECKEATHTPKQGDGRGLLAFLSRPRRPQRECGYCGHDLTLPAGRE